MEYLFSKLNLSLHEVQSITTKTYTRDGTEWITLQISCGDSDPKIKTGQEFEITFFMQEGVRPVILEGEGN